MGTHLPTTRIPQAINVVQKHYKESSVDDVPLTGLDSSLLGRSQGSGTMRFFRV